MATAKVIITGQNNIGSAVKSAQSDLTGFSQAAQKVGDTLKKAFTVTAIIVAIKKLGDAASACLSDFLQAERAYKRLALTLKDASTYKSVTTNIAKLSKQTLSSKSDIEAMVSELAALGKTADDINAISDAAVYLSNVTGKDLNSSMTTLLNTYNGNVTQLRKLGVDTSELTKKELEQGAAVQLVIDKFGALSKQMAESDTSQHIQNIKNNIGDMKQSLGDLINFTIAPLLGRIDAATERMKDRFDAFVQRVKVVLENFPEVWKNFVTAIKGGLSNLFSIEGFTNFLSNFANSIISLIKLIGNAVANLMSLIQGIGEEAVEGLGNYAMYWITHICDSLGINISETINSIGDWLLESPIGKVVDQIISKAVNGVRLIGNIIKNIPQIVKIVMKNIGTMISSFFTNIPKAIKEIFLGVFDWVAYAVVRIKNNFVQSIEDALQTIGSKLHNTWVGRVFGLGGKLEKIDLNIDRTSERELYSKTNAHFENVGATFSNIGNDLAPITKEIEALLNPAFEKFTADNATTIGKIMAKWTTKNTDDYYKAAKKNFANISDFLDDWGKTFLGDLSENWGDLKSLFENVFSDAFGGDWDKFLRYLRNLTSKPIDGSTQYGTANNSNDKNASNGASFLDNAASAVGGLFSKVFDATAQQGLVAAQGLMSKLLNGLGEAGELISNLAQNMMTMGPELGAIVTALQYVVEGFASVVSGPLNELVQYILEPLREFGRILGELLVPLIKSLMPLIKNVAEFCLQLFHALGVILKPIIEILGSVLKPVLDIITSVLDALSPVLKVFAKIIITVTGTIQYVVQVLQHWIATIMNWLAGLNIFGWHPFGGLRMSDPGSPGSYSAFIKSKWASVDEAFERGSAVANGITDSSSMNTSTATSISSAGYQGATQVTINIFQQAPVVGDGGMREFARMIRDEFTQLNYYGVTI